MRPPIDRPDRFDTTVCVIAAVFALTLLVAPFVFGAWVIHHIVWSVWP